MPKKVVYDNVYAMKNEKLTDATLFALIDGSGSVPC